MTPTFAGEMQLAGWSESHTGGCKVTFWLQSPEEMAAFRALTVRKGNTAGHRFMAALVEIGDDEQPIEPILPDSRELEIKTRAHMGDACYRTVRWCQEPTFWAFLDTKYCTGDGSGATNAKEAAWLVKEICEVESRKQLDTDNEANKTWHREIREPYSRWLKEREAACPPH